MKKYLLYIIGIIGIILSMKNGYCCDTDKLIPQEVATNEFREQLECNLEEQFIFDNYMYYFGVSSNQIVNGATNMFICFFDNNVNYYIQGTAIKYEMTNGGTNSYKCIRTSLNNLNGANHEIGFNKWGSMQQVNLNWNYYTYYSSINLYDTNNTLKITKNFDYSKPTGGGNGPVEITNFPIDKNEFYVLLVLIATLILMLFLKWCFPFKGGKKQ